MIEHRGCNKQASYRVSDEPNLVGYSQGIRGSLSILFGGFTISRIIPFNAKSLEL